jgi:hypothetical protein
VNPDPRAAVVRRSPSEVITMRLQWVNRGRVEAYVDDRMVVVGGEALLGRDDPDYVIFARTVTRWNDGAPIDMDDRADIIDRVIEAAADRGWKFEVEWD